MLSMLSVVLCFTFIASAVAQSSPSVVCVAGQCVQGFSNITIGAKLSASGASTSVHLLPGQYTDTTNPQLLHGLLTSSSATLNTSPGFGNATLSSLPLNVDLQPGLAIYSLPRYSGQAAFSQLPTSPIGNNATPLSASSLAPSTNVWVAVSSGSSSNRIIIWDAVPDVAQLPSSASSSLSLLDIQSNACSPACSGSGVCSAAGTCVCPTGFAGSSCETCAEGFFGPTCQPCPAGCPSCDQGIAGSGRCLAPVVTNAPSTCSCLNGQCGANGQCACNPGWTTANNGTACAECASGFFLSSTGDCQVCQLGCTQCADGTATCIACKTGFTQDENDKTKCDALPSTTTTGTICPDGSFSSGTACTPCSASCRTCTGPSSNDCIICAAGQYLFNGNCVSANTDGVCQGSNGMIADNNKNECDSCGAKCTSCKIPNFSVASTVNQLQCTGCLPGFVLSGGKCVESCPAGTFVSPQDNLTCIACSSSCGTCVGSANFCLTCPAGQLASGGQCVTTCPSNTFTSSGACVKCHPDCASCTGPSFNQCSTCNPTLPVLSSGRCLPTCTKSQYFDKTSSSCQTCDSSCSSCSGPGASNCLACASSTQVLRSGACVAANCGSASNVIPGLGVCLSDLVQTPTVSGTTAPAPTITGLADPIVINTRRPLAWWEILLMALGCAFIFLVIVMFARRRAQKQRAKRTALFASAKRLDNRHGWKWRIARFGERLFGHRGGNRNKLQKEEMLPVAYNHHDDPRTKGRPEDSVYSVQDIKMTNLGSSNSSKSAPPRVTRVPVPKDDVDLLIDSYADDSYAHSAYTRSSRAPSTLPGLEDREYLHKQNQRRIERDSLYHEVTDRVPTKPLPRQTLRRDVSGASRFSSSTTSSGRTRNLTTTAREGVLVDLDEDDERNRITPLPLQMVNTAANAAYAVPRFMPAPTEAQVYAMSVRPEVTGGSQQQLSQPMTLSLSTMGGTNGNFMPMPVTLTPNTAGGQGSYWLTPVAAQAQQSPQQQQQYLNFQGPSQDTVVLQPMNTGGSFSRNPFRHGI